MLKVPFNFVLMKNYGNKPKQYVGKIKRLASYKIYLNVKHLNKGSYELNIVNKNKLIKRTHFDKE